MLQAVIFDFDGVIADSELLHYKALNEMFKRCGVDVPKEVHWGKYLGYTDRENILAVNRDFKMGLDAAQMEELLREKGRLFESLAKAEAPIIDGVADFVGLLARAGIHRAICSGAAAKDIQTILRGSGFIEAFEVIVSAEDVTKGKPDPQGYLLCLQRLCQKTGKHILPGRCVVIEDSHWGLQAAMSAGMHRVAVTTTYSAEQLADKAELVTASLKNLKIEDLQRICQMAL